MGENATTQRARRGSKDSLYAIPRSLLIFYYLPGVPTFFFQFSILSAFNRIAAIFSSRYVGSLTRLDDSLMTPPTLITPLPTNPPKKTKRRSKGGSLVSVTDSAGSTAPRLRCLSFQPCRNCTLLLNGDRSVYSRHPVGGGVAHKF